MRGTGENRNDRLVLHRFIPAHAGNRTSSRSAPGPTAVHPRACGEQKRLLFLWFSISGSSPRMRGTVSRGDTDHGGLRFIPAHAGNSRFRAFAAPFTSVHPRACGEQCSLLDLASRSNGSSPRMRGTDQQEEDEMFKKRFIPAHAGNRFDRSGLFTRIAVHPRACGEHNTYPGSTLKACGSSPRMRGTDLLSRLRPATCRFIPAHAGNSLALSTWCWISPVHPRACGEQPLPITAATSISGSSPRMRGTVRWSMYIIINWRFIPAHAGNSSPRWSLQKNPPVHPRACGEQLSLISCH